MIYLALQMALNPKKTASLDINSEKTNYSTQLFCSPNFFTHNQFSFVSILINLPPFLSKISCFDARLDACADFAPSFGDLSCSFFSDGDVGLLG
jgi:hypothetical protein